MENREHSYYDINAKMRILSGQWFCSLGALSLLLSSLFLAPALSYWWVTGAITTRNLQVFIILRLCIAGAMSLLLIRYTIGKTGLRHWPLLIILFMLLRTQLIEYGSFLHTKLSITILSMGAYYIMGFFMLDALRFSLAKQAMIVLLLLLVTVVFSNVQQYRLSMNFFDVVHQEKALHQELGDSIAMSLLCIMPIIRKYRYRIPLIVTTTIALFLVGSRASFFAIIPSILLILHQDIPRKRWIFIWGIAGALIILFITNLPEPILSSIIESRILEPIRAPGGGTSFEVRISLLREGLFDIMNHPIWGEPGIQYQRHKSYGYYIHNVLSYWRQFGILPFGAIIIVLVFSGVKLFRSCAVPAHMAPLRRFAQSIFLFVGISCIAARAFNWPHLWFFIGMSATAWYRQITMRSRGSKSLMT